jgi:hypothetical protein
MNTEEGKHQKASHLLWSENLVGSDFTQTPAEDLKSTINFTGRGNLDVPSGGRNACESEYALLRATKLTGEVQTIRSLQCIHSKIDRNWLSERETGVENRADNINSWGSRRELIPIYWYFRDHDKLRWIWGEGLGVIWAIDPKSAMDDWRNDTEMARRQWKRRIIEGRRDFLVLGCESNQGGQFGTRAFRSNGNNQKVLFYRLCRGINKSLR